MSQDYFRKEVLENGLTILTEKIDTIRSISLGVWLKKGSQDETREVEGTYHFIEHMLFKGTERRNAYEVAKIIDSIGGFTDAFTSKENTCFYAKILDEHLPIILDLFSDILIRPTFLPEDIERERGVVLEEIKMVEDTPSDLVHEIFLENYWRDHPLGRPILGTVETVRAINQELLRNHFVQNYVPANMLITAAGNVEHESLVQSIREYFPLKASSAGRPTNLPPVKAQPMVLLRPKKDLEQAHLTIGTKGYSATHPDRYAAGVMNVILGGSMSSRLFQRLREERGLCYTIFSSNSSFKDAGYTSIYAGTSPDQVRTAIELIVRECNLLFRESVTGEELENAKNHLKGSLILSLESSSNRMFSLAKNEIYHQRQIPPEETLEKISAVTIGDVQRVASELFENADYATVVVGDLDNLGINLESFKTFQ
jgi:predicted Zn-dependent peptidase